jgi:hypothetical protein
VLVDASVMNTRIEGRATVDDQGTGTVIVPLPRIHWRRKLAVEDVFGELGHQVDNIKRAWEMCRRHTATSRPGRRRASRPPHAPP